MSLWFRVHTEIVNSYKIQSLPDHLFKFLINLWCIAKENKGFIPRREEIAFRLHLLPQQAQDALQDLVERGLVDQSESGAASPHDWDHWQFQSDISADRVGRYRERVRANGSTVGGYLKHKEEVLKRDGFSCVYCASKTNLVIDHVVPVILGGDDHIDNLATACKACSSGKAGRTPGLARMSFVTGCAYVTVNVRNMSRLVTVTETMESRPQSRAEQRTDTESRAEKPSAPSGARLVAPNGHKSPFPDSRKWFEKCYAIYWRKKSPDSAWTAWQRKVTTPALAQELESAIIAQAPEYMSREPTYRPHMATWINAGGWRNQPELPVIGGKLTKDQETQIAFEKTMASEAELYRLGIRK